LGNLGSYFARRLLASVVTLWIIVSLAFALVRLAPGDPAEIWLGDYATPELIEATRARMGLDQPIVTQYVSFIGRVATGDLGNSVRTGRSVSDTILAQYPFTLQLTVGALFIAVTFGILTGVVSAMTHNSRLDFVMVLGSVTWIAMPSFWFGLILIYIFSVYFGWFPITGAGERGNILSILHHLILPAIALGARQAAVITRMSRSAMLDVLRTDYVRTARAKGLSERKVIGRHAFRNALIPITSLTAIETMVLLSGSVVIEVVFSRPGVGQLLVTAVSQRDYPMIQGAIFFFATAVILINLLTDVAYAAIDPRVRLD
jgi:ABC-type dipeptide/oligopeptide/nickel transport system permease component